MTGSRSPCAPCHVGVQDAAMVVVDRGRGPLMAKVDMQNAYRHIPIHPDDQWLMGMLWEGDLYINTALPIGLRSALKISMAIADACTSEDRKNSLLCPSTPPLTSDKMKERYLCYRKLNL